MHKVDFNVWLILFSIYQKVTKHLSQILFQSMKTTNTEKTKTNESALEEKMCLYFSLCDIGDIC